MKLMGVIRRMFLLGHHEEAKEARAIHDSGIHRQSATQDEVLSRTKFNRARIDQRITQMGESVREATRDA